MDSRNCKHVDFECITCERCEHFESLMPKYQMCNNCRKPFKPTENSRIEIKNKEAEEYYRCPHCDHVNIKIDDKRIANKTGSSY